MNVILSPNRSSLVELPCVSNYSPGSLTEPNFRDCRISVRVELQCVSNYSPGSSTEPNFSVCRTTVRVELQCVSKYSAFTPCHLGLGKFIRRTTDVCLPVFLRNVSLILTLLLISGIRLIKGLNVLTSS